MAQGTQPRLETETRNAETVNRLLVTVREFVGELHPQRKSTLRVSLDSRLDRDLALDSLGRAELLTRLERAFDARLPQDLLAGSETVRDLLDGLLEAEAKPRESSDGQIDLEGLETAEATPADAGTLWEVLDWHVERHAERPQILLADEAASQGKITYGKLAEEARCVAEGFRQRRLQPGDRVAIMLPTGADFFYTFFGVLAAGCVPVPIYPPVRPAQIEDHLRRQAAILNNAKASALVTVPEAKRVAGLLQSHVPSLKFVETRQAIRVEGKEQASPSLVPSDLALLQYTSGSTGQPKGVMLTHRNLLANIRAMGRAVKADSSDICVSWLPLYHDMGLIGAWLGTLYFAIPTVILSPLTFLSRPEKWLWAIHRHRATASAAPNFAFELCLNKVKDEDIEGLDLSSLRLVMNGAEPVSPATIRRFTERFQKYGFRPEAMAPVYGMAENTVALAIPPMGRVPVIDRIQRQAMTSRGEAIEAGPNDSAALEFVACGQSIPGHEVRVVDDVGQELGERRQGRLQFRGPSATSGYFQNEQATRELFDGRWLNSGDLAYISGADVYITGRSKDVIIRAGRNIYPQEVEEAAGNVEGIRKGCAAVFGTTDSASGTERIIVVAETREEDESKRVSLVKAVEDAAGQILENPPDEVVLVPPHTVPKTSSGKIRRAETRQLYERGKLGTGRRALWWQLGRLWAEGMLRRVRRLTRSAGELAYGAYWWVVVVLFVGGCLPVVMLLPRLGWRWGVARGTARAILRLTGLGLRVEGIERLPDTGCVAAVNHASYIDGAVVAAALPKGNIFVVKGELAPHWFLGTLLRNLDSLFVERIETGGSVEDARKAVRKAQAGRRMIFFPEGTFWRKPGLLAFRMGAFVTAAQAGLPVVPVVMQGTRSVLRDESWLPRRGDIHVEICDPIVPEGSDFEAAVRLRDRVRAVMLERSGEPDLAGEHLVFSEAGIESVDTEST